MLAGTRGGYTRGFILNKLADKPYNTNQLAEALNIDYQTTSHHLDVLANNGIITTESDEYCRIFGILLYVFFSPKADIHHLKELFTSEENILIRTMETKERFLANFIKLLHKAYRKVK
ncbi:MAG: winged helix-turn-helix transcriptional regulator [Candidatus Methanoperedens sp.]|nr:winged helix-turn-helix transcriptional regulator [Candidatus Methanoperedens sp.]